MHKVLEIYQKSFELREQLYANEQTSLSLRDVYGSYERLAYINEQIAKYKIFKKKYLNESLHLYTKALLIAEQLVKIEDTIDAYDDFMLILYRIAMHPYTISKIKKELLMKAIKIAEMLYDNLPNERYENFLMMFYKELIGMGE